MKMTAKKTFYVMIAGTVLISLATVAAVVLGNSLLQKQSAKLVDLKLNNEVLNQQQSAVLTAKKDIDKYADLEKTAQAIVPQDKDQAQTVLQIVNIAQASHISLTGFVFQTSNLGQTTVTPVAAPTGTTAAPKAAVLPSVSQAQPVQGVSGLYALPITVQQDPTKPTTFAQIIAFMDALEQNRRTAQESQISIQPDARNPNLLTFTMQLNVFIKP